MPYFPNLKINFVAIPSNASIPISYKLLEFDQFDGLPQDEEIYNNIIFEEKFIKKRYDFENCHWPDFSWKYPQSYDSVSFSVIRNPFSRMVSLFYDLTFSHKDYANLRPLPKDSSSNIQSKFLDFIILFKDIKNMQAGIGLANIEAITESLGFPDRDKLIRFTPQRYSDSRYHPQHSFFFKDFMNHSFYFMKNGDKRKIHFIRYERLDLELSTLFPILFKEKLPYISFSKNYFDKIEKKFKKLPTIEVKDFYNEKSKFYVREIFEEDFFRFHYNPDVIND